MGIGAWFNAAIVAVICIALLGFATSPAVHQAVWDGAKDLLPIDELLDHLPDDDDDDGDNGDNTFFLFPEYAVLQMNQTITITASGGDINDFFVRLVAPQEGGNESRGDPLTQTNVDVDGAFIPDEQFEIVFLPNPIGSWGWAWVNITKNGSAPVIADGESVHIHIIYNVTSNFTWWPEAANDSGAIGTIPSWATDTYMGDMLWSRAIPGQVGYEPGLASIQTLAEDIVGSETNVYEILRAIFLWMHDNIDYEVGHPDLRTVTETLAAGAGDCDDQSLLFVSLARAAGVPAWMQMGMLYNDQANTWENHVWVQTYIPGVGNVTIDPSNDLFLINRPDRITTYTDQGIAEDMEMFYFFAAISGSGGIQQSLTPEYYFRSPTEIQVPYAYMR